MSARAIAHPVFYSLHDYVILERTSPPKHEYIVGQIYAMSGGTPEHARLADASVVCGEPHTDPVDANAVTNPIVLVEVTSPSTEVYDRGEKFEYYKQIPSLREYVIVSHRDPVIEVWRRTGNRWTRHAARAGEQLELRSVDVTLDVDAIYQAAARARKSKSGAHRRLTSRNGGVRRRSR
jgi:Uma2 family endonuclease